MTFRPTRRGILATGLSAGALWLLPQMSRAVASEGVRLGEPEPFSFDDLKRIARELSSEPYRAPELPHFDELETIGYDAHNQITYKPENTLWGDFEHGPPIRFFHAGRYFKEPIRVAVLENGQARRVIYDLDYFDMPADSPARALPDDYGFAGFRVMHEDEERDWLAVLGASYFRTSGPFDQFGLSARGIAVDTAASGPEEFPRFSRFWLERDGEGGLTSYALLEGPRVTGAYRIASRRENGVVQDIEAVLFVRGDIERLGIAPLTSMFWYGENNRELSTDWRPEIHDSDGLEMWTGEGERIWRPLTNPPGVMTNAFTDRNPRGFGLMQRDRSFENYQDDGVFYERRASLWVEPLGDWGEGSVQLVEIPTDDEIHDNIGAFWVPAEAARDGAEFDFRYRLHWLSDNPYPGETARVAATRLGAGGAPGQERPDGIVKFVIDFDGAGMERFDRESGVEVDIVTSRGEVVDAAAYPVVSTRRWRAMFDIEVDGDEPVDLRMFLRIGNEALSETWIYQYFPADPRRV